MEFGINMAHKEMEHIIRQYLQKDENGAYVLSPRQMLPIYLIGPAGIGKTQVVEEIAKEQDLGFVSYSMVHHTRQTLMGLPVITNFTDGEQEIKDTEYTLSEVLGSVYRQKGEGHKEGILLLDEANCCSETIQPMLLAFLQSKTLGNHKLPEGWIIMLCGNPPRSVYNRNARAWDGALMDRLRVIELKTDHQDYLRYIYQRNFHPAVRIFLTMYPKSAYICRDHEKYLELVTYRTWENLSGALYDYEKLQFEVTPLMINEYVKDDTTVRSFYEVYCNGKMDYSEYEEIARHFQEGNTDMKMLRSLKGKPTMFLYGIINLAFQKLETRAQELLKKHEILKELKAKIIQKDRTLQGLLENSKLNRELEQKLRVSMQQLSDEEMWKQCLELHNDQIELLKKEKGDLVVDMLRLFKELRKLEEPVLSRFYANTISWDKAWIYVTSDTDKKQLEQIRKECV